nr:putative ribonuclease H-like domain-containing protein [Tanacetum cinerariifolium]
MDNVLPRALAWSNVTKFEKNDYNRLFGSDSNPDLELYTTPVEKQTIWFIASVVSGNFVDLQHNSVSAGSVFSPNSHEGLNETRVANNKIFLLERGDGFFYSEGGATNLESNKDKPPMLADVLNEVRALRKEVSLVKFDDARISKLERIFNDNFMFRNDTGPNGNHNAINQGLSGSANHPMSTCSRPDIDNGEVADHVIGIHKADGKNDSPNTNQNGVKKGLSCSANDHLSTCYGADIWDGEVAGALIGIHKADGKNDSPSVNHIPVNKGLSCSANDLMSICSSLDIDNVEVAIAGTGIHKADGQNEIPNANDNAAHLPKRKKCGIERNYVLRSVKKRKKWLAMSLDSPFGQQATTTPAPPKTISRSVNGDFITPLEFLEANLYVGFWSGGLISYLDLVKVIRHGLQYWIMMIKNYNKWRITNIKDKHACSKTQPILKNDFKKEESRNIDREIALEKKIKHLDYIVYKKKSISGNCSYVDKIEVFYDHTTKQALGFQNPFYLKKAQQLEPKLYDDPTPSNRPTKFEISKELPKVSMVNTSLKKLKHHLAGIDVVVKERTTTTAITEAVEQNHFESKTFEIKMNQVLNENERLLEQVINKDIVNIVVNSTVDNASVNVHEYEKCLKLETELLKKRISLKKRLTKNCSEEQAVILREVVEQGKSQNPLNNSLDHACRTFTMVGNACPLTRIITTAEVFLRKPTSLECDSPKPEVTLLYSRKPKKSKSIDPFSKSKYLDPGCSKHMTEDRSQLTNFVSKFLGSVKIGKNHVAKIIGYGDYQIGNVTISRVYCVEGLGHNLFSVRQFCDLNLKVAFHQHTCYICSLEGDDILTGSQWNNLYTLSLGDMMVSSPICLLSKASKTKSWIWHRRLSHLNFCAINHLARPGLVRGLPKLKFEKDHLCSACPMGKIKKKPHKPKYEDTNQEKLYLLHMDLCGPMRVASVNGKKYILVVVDDYSQFTWVKCLRSKDEASDFIIKFLKMIQVQLKTPVRRIRTDNENEFVNQTLRKYYETVGISHETFVARSLQQNCVVERHNRTLIEAARTMLIYAKASLFLWVKAVATACYTQNHSIIRLRHEKTPYELLHNKPPDLSFLHVFGALCYPPYDSDNLGKYNQKLTLVFSSAMPPQRKHSGFTNDVPNELLKQFILGLVPNPPPSTSFVPSSRTDWDLLFQPLFDELLTSPPSVDNLAPEFIALITEVVAQVPTVSTSSPSSTTVDQDSPSHSNSQTTPETQTLVISNDVEEDNHHLDVAHMNNDLIVGVEESPKTPNFRDAPLHESLLEDSASQGSSSNMRQTLTPSNYLQLQNDAMWCFFDAFLTTVEPKSFKQAMTEPSWIDAMQEEIHEFKRLQVWEVLKNKARLVTQIFRQEEGIDFEESFASDNPSHVYKLKKALYGLKQAPHAWYGMLSRFLISQHFSKGAVDSTLFTWKARNDLLLEQVENRIVELYFVRTEYQLADIFTKPLPQERFNFLIDKLGMKSMSPEMLKRLAEETDE